MVDKSIIPALRDALKENEIGSGSPYVLSYARLGQSGASFGMFQGDTNVDPDASKTLRKVLEAYGADTAVCDRIVDAVSRPCPDGSPLSRDDQKTADLALSSDTGKQLVDAMDGRTLDIIISELDSCLKAAKGAGLAIDPDAQLCIALWVNMTGEPDSLMRWIKGEVVGGVTPPGTPAVRRSDMTAYLKGTKYFKIHPRNLVHFEDSVDVGVKKLPSRPANVAPLAAAQIIKGVAAKASDNVSVFVENVVLVATTEWNRFDNQTYDIHGHVTHVGHKEGEEGLYERIGTYWLEGTNVHGVNGRNHELPWSAAFISFVMKEAGAGDRFRYSTQHSVYIYQGIRDLLARRDDAGFWGWRLNEYKPKLGDLVCWSRQAGVDYDHQDGGVYKGHCDIIVAVEDDRLFVIGGNVGDSVTRRPLPLNAQGYLAPTQQGGEILFALMENRIS